MHDGTDIKIVIPPVDGFPVVPDQLPVWYFEVTTVNLVVYFTMVALVAMGIGYSAFCIVFSVCCRNEQ